MVDPTLRRDILNAVATQRVADSARLAGQDGGPTAGPLQLSEAQVIALARRAAGLVDAGASEPSDRLPVGADRPWWDPRAYLPDYSRAEAIADEEKARRKGHNDGGDAMRHAEWSRRAYNETGPFTAWSAGLGHEMENWLGLDGRFQPWREGLMDLHNNQEGRAAAREGRPVNPRNLRTDPSQVGGAY